MKPLKSHCQDIQSIQNQAVRKQFNSQAKLFAAWQKRIQSGHFGSVFKFCGLRPKDHLLDVACGPGEFAIYCAERLAQVCGVDISELELELANRFMVQKQMTNIRFDHADVEHLPYSNRSFSVITCRSAFHHFSNPDLVFKEMVRCCQHRGKVMIQDILAFEEEEINTFFETLEKLIDNSHIKALTNNEFNQLLTSNGVNKLAAHQFTVELNLKEYIRHAFQEEGSLQRIAELVDQGLKNPSISNYLYYKDTQLFIKRHYMMILGR